MLRCVALVRTDISEEFNATFTYEIFLTSKRRTLRRNTKTAVLTRATRRNIPEDGIVHSHRRENLKSYTGPSRIKGSIFLQFQAI
jgi:hypothetical protein